MASSERIKTYGGDIVDDASAIAGDDDNDNISTTIMGTQEHHDDDAKAPAGKISPPPPSATTTSSYYYNSFHNSDEAAGYITALKSPPPATTSTKAVSRGASTEFEELLSSTIISLLEKIIPRWDIPKRLELLHSLSSSRYRSLEFADSNHYKTTGLDNHHDNDGYDLLDYIESQHVSIDDDDDDDDVQFQSLDNTAPPSLLLDQGRTPKANNLKTKGLEDNALDTTTAATLKAHDTTNRHNRHQHQSRHHSRRQHSNSPTEYLPQSAAIILQALQQCCNNNSTTNNNNLENGSYQKVEDILSFILQNSKSGIGSSLVGGEGELIDENAGGGGNNVDAANHDEGSASIQQQPPPPAPATMNKDGDDSFESNHNNNNNNNNHHHHHHDNDNYDYYDDDDSLKGDMARLSQSVAHLQRDLDNIDTSRFDWMYYHNNDDEDGGGGTTTDQQQYLEGRDIIGNRWKCWIRNWLLSHGIIKDEKDEKVVNSLLLPYGDNDDDATRRGRGGLTIFDYEMDHVFVVTLLLVFFVLLRNRFKTINDLLLFDEEDSDNDSGGMWQIFDTYGWGYF